MYIHVYSYDSDIPKTFHNELRCVAQRSCYPKIEPWFRVTMLTSMKGRGFSSFAKYTRFGDGECLQIEQTFQDSSVIISCWVDDSHDKLFKAKLGTHF